ncbi:hypothetical protein ArV1_097 [Arthrobacter phage vB_ArtM-ArV1]|uniref:Uncharacterized protein n=1 Tax=Arthrobacter phage vB_ArtM-ArV1 TaxID=1566993 RepID=A0A0A7HEW8_9CAUD|nr:amidase [Arthrobacter phage vB_ArtM-ArV1]AIZ01784.1 hypothetical protein ArV1_097 [Arthrobacter phage vB_ArtM-ArV1]
MGKITEFFRTLWHGSPQPRLEMPDPDGKITRSEAQQAMEVARQMMNPSEASKRADYEIAVQTFIRYWTGLDAVSNGLGFGPQSPTLIQEFMRGFVKNWTWITGNAADLADYPEVMAPTFYQVPAAAPVRYGDIVVFKRDALHPHGNVGIVAKTPIIDGYVNVFTQTYTDGCRVVLEPANLAAIYRKNHAAEVH